MGVHAFGTEIERINPAGLSIDDKRRVISIACGSDGKPSVTPALDGPAHFIADIGAVDFLATRQFKDSDDIFAGANLIGAVLAQIRHIDGIAIFGIIPCFLNLP